MANPVPNLNDGSANMSPVAYERIAANGTLTLGKNLVFLTKASALGTTTLAAPTNPDMNGQMVTIVSQTAAAHVITATDLINGDDDTMTFGAAIGNCIQLYADGGEWFSGMLIGVTIS
ncbi:hypothetical protein LCGC14_2208330 [marine sediment metagenome]|uniref:Uncharacterized protein n=1 Tax=marine sediment metagenome TaxID=412755 RepID=A0A0F9DEG3_9ZZZZ